MGIFRGKLIGENKDIWDGGLRALQGRDLWDWLGTQGGQGALRHIDDMQCCRSGVGDLPKLHDSLLPLHTSAGSEFTTLMSVLNSQPRGRMNFVLALLFDQQRLM